MQQYLTSNDVANYGGDLLDVTQRAALQAVSPHLTQLQQDNARLQQRLAIEARRNLDQRVAAAVPDYMEIDRNPAWHRWLLGIDSLSGRVRQTLLNEAISASDLHRVKGFFDGFKREVGSAQAPAATQQTQARAASQRMVYDRPMYTRQQIAKLYDRHMRGAYNGREAEWNRIEADIIAAGRENRVLNTVDLHGK